MAFPKLRPRIGGPQQGRLTQRRTRRKRRGFHRLYTAKWVDPYPYVPGTEPEKRIFAALIERGIFFVFQDSLVEQIAARQQGLYTPRFQPDFILPQYRVIIDPFGDYHHTLPGAVENDMEKEAFYIGLGYAFYHPWATEVNSIGGMGILQMIPELSRPPLYNLSAQDIPWLAQGYRLGPNVGVGTRSVAAANRNRRKWKQPSLRARR